MRVSVLHFRILRQGFPRARWLAWLAVGCWFTGAFGAERLPQATVIATSGRVEFLTEGSATWYAAGSNLVLYAGDQLRTGERSRAVLRLRDQSVVPIRELTSLRLQDRPQSVLVQLLQGVVSFFHRDQPGSVGFEGGGVTAAVRGTEVAFALSPEGAVQVTLFDGAVQLTDARSNVLQLANGETATAAPGQAARKAAAVALGDWSAIQWALHYPAILNPGELGWTPGADSNLQPAWQAFRRGNLPRALALYPPNHAPESDPERVFLAALLLSVGSVEEAEQRLAAVPTDSPLRRLADTHAGFIDAIRRGPGSAWVQAIAKDASSPSQAGSGSPTETLARSYALQFVGRLGDAGDAVRALVDGSPGFGFASVRWAELELSLGRRRAAEAALQLAREQVPDHPGARALQGFVLAAANSIGAAESAFREALDLDPSLAPAWLGRGLCRIRQGDLVGGREDVAAAAALEPQSALHRSYLGKAFADSKPFGTPARADKARAELDLARRLDPGDPTPWLYTALLDEQENRLNDAITDLDESTRRNNGRALFRSRAGLDQDLAVRSANLARVFGDAGFRDFAVREASRAVNFDYANAPAHLFLAHSYDALRDPRQINLRYESPWLGEYLIANLLAPVGAGSLSQTVAQNEYSKLFERDRLGIANATTWTSNGDWLQQSSQFGQTGNLAYSLDAYYRSEVGQRPNNDLEQLAFSATVHLQATPSDTLLVQAGWYDAETGDVLQRYDPDRSLAGLRIHERHEPLGFVGWNHEWQPGNHTLVLVAPWNAHQDYVNPDHRVPFVLQDANGQVFPTFDSAPLTQYDSRLTGVSLEVQQLWTLSDHTLIAGSRYQSGGFDTTAVLDTSFDPAVAARSAVDPRVERTGFYAYDQWRLIDPVLLTAGVAWDRLRTPENFRTAPLTEGNDTIDRVSPKLGLTYEPWNGGLLRGAYARTLGGVSFDQSFSLEPVQIAGFNQAWRSLIPEALEGSVAGQQMETIGAGFDQRFPTRTWVTFEAERLTSNARRDIGGFAYGPAGYQAVAPYREEVHFVEDSLAATVGQLVGRDLALTVRYRVADAELDSVFPAFVGQRAFDTHQASILQQLVLGARYHHPRGFFAGWETTWNHQSNEEDIAALAGDDFWRHDLRVGWRFWQRRAEVSFEVLNLTGQDYRLHPLNYYPETYRSRTYGISGKFAF